jgi:hypothetical protein
MPATPAGNIGEQLGREQLVAVVGNNGVHRPVGDQVTTPPRRVQLVIGWVDVGRMPGSLPGHRQQPKPRPDLRQRQGAAQACRRLIRLATGLGSWLRIRRWPGAAAAR